MGGGGNGDKGPLQIESEVKKDKITQARETELWLAAERLAGGDPFSKQYPGGASALPGMGAMSQAGQQYLTDAILGSGQYQSQNLGFTDYERGVGGSGAGATATTQSPGSAIRPSGEYIGLLGAGDVSTSPTVGIGGMQMGGLATRRMLEEAAPETPDFTSITAPTIGTTRVGDVSDIGTIGQATMPAGASLTFQEAKSRLQGQGRLHADQTGTVGDTVRLSDGSVVSPFEYVEPGIGIGDVTPQDIGRTTVTSPQQITAQEIGGPGAVGLGEVMAPELAGVTGAGVERITGRDIAGPAGVTIDPVTGQMTQAVGAVAPGEIGGPGAVTIDPVSGASFLGGPAIQDYMNVAGVEAQVAQSQEDYLREQNRLQAEQAQAQAWGVRGQLPGEAASEAQQRNVAAIRGAGFDRAAQMLEADIARQQQAALAGQQLGTQAAMQTQQLAQAGDIRGAELGLQAGMQGQQLEAQRREADAARAQQAALAGQQLGTQAGMQTQELQQQAAIQGAQNALTAAQSNQQAVMQSGTQQQQLEAARQTEEARLSLSAAQQTQQLGAQVGMQGQQLGTQVDVQNAQNALSASQANLDAAMQSGDRQAQIDAQRQMRDAELGVQTAMQTQQLDVQAGMQQQQLGTQVAMQNAQNEIRIAEQNMQSALQTGNQQAAIDAQRQMAQSQMRLDAAARDQAAALQAAELGLDAQGQFRGQQLAAAQQLADIGGMQQGATFGAAAQLQQMGAQQEQTRRLQQAWDYEQWLRGQEGGAQALALRQGMMPGGSMQTFGRRPDRFGQILGAVTSLGGAKIMSGSDVRIGA